jgi:subtilase family serine protease
MGEVRRGCGSRYLLFVAMLVLGWSATAAAQNGGELRRSLITQPIDASQLVPLIGNTYPEATAANDQGRVPDDMPLPHMLLELHRAADQEQAVAAFVATQHDPSSPNYHRWLSAAAFGQKFGLSASDIQTITGWLAAQGFTVGTVYPNQMTIDFSGTAGAVRTAFHTEIHYLAVNGVQHYANMSDPMIPAALAPAVTGIVALHDFRPHPGFTRSGGGPYSYQVAPADLATIYDVNPLFAAGFSGQGQTIAVVEDSDMFATSDWQGFRTAFGLASQYPAATFAQVHPAPPSGANNCSDPGVNASADEAALDAQWASAAAPSAAIVLAACTDTSTAGVLIATENLINAAVTPTVISMSYGHCEALLGAATNATYNSTYQQAASEGISVFVIAGDDGGGGHGCQANGAILKDGLGVNGMGSTVYNVSVGGTDFGDTYAGTNKTYWAATNSATFGSAKSYVPEIPWNGSCASQLLASFNGFSVSYGAGGFCNSAAGAAYQTTFAGGGGPSGCATGTPSTSDVVSGTCQGWPKPSWQAGLVGNPNDGVRDVPDIALFAANGAWGHSFAFCVSRAVSFCTATDPTTYGFGYGTSFATPIMAGFQALIDQYTGERQGNPDPVYYRLANAQYGANGNAACNATLGNTIAGNCIFHDITQGDNDVPCTGSNNCYLPSGTYGVSSLSSSSFELAYLATVGWDFTSGIGSVDVYNLATNWNGAVPLVAAVLPESRSAVINNAVTAFATIINTGGSTAPGCSISPIDNLPINFVYQTTNPSTNALTGSPNTPIDIAAGQPQSFVIALTPTAAFTPVQLPFSFACSNIVSAPVEVGLNTLLVSSSATPVPDIVALVATASNDGILHIPGALGSNAFAVATVNLGSSSAITATANTGSTTLPLTISLCETDPASGRCSSAIGSSATVTITANATPTFGIFATASGAVPFAPANSRIFVRFTDAGGVERGATSVAVETQ